MDTEVKKAVIGIAATVVIYTVAVVGAKHTSNFVLRKLGF